MAKDEWQLQVQQELWRRVDDRLGWLDTAIQGGCDGLAQTLRAELHLLTLLEKDLVLLWSKET